MKKYLTAVVAAVAFLGVLVVGVQSQTLNIGAFSWTHIGLYPFSNKSVHVVKYGDETICSRLLDVGEAPWVRANADRTLSVSYGKVGQQTTVHYSVDKKDYVTPTDGLESSNDFNFTTLAMGTNDSYFGKQVKDFSRRVDNWSR
ncbi:MAG: hypothetical protein IJB33_07275 [Akkermansia sp.]|nr:hypothetical protein [Akkermansia sp.]MBQ7023184.1 hypothetical protein [Akkermansia sp.]